MLTGNLLHQTGPNLCHFLWWRVVCDEAHEILDYDKVTGPSVGLRTVVGFQSRRRWYVTGTPFPHGLDSLRAALQVTLIYLLFANQTTTVLFLCIQCRCSNDHHFWQKSSLIIPYYTIFKWLTRPLLNYVNLNTLRCETTVQSYGRLLQLLKQKILECL